MHRLIARGESRRVHCKVSSTKWSTNQTPASTNTEPSGLPNSGLSVHLLQVSGRPERQPAAGFSCGDDAEAKNDRRSNSLSKSAHCIARRRHSDHVGRLHLMASDDQDPGRASGYSVDEASNGGFRWSAFGPAGTREGNAESRADAEAAAQSAERELCRPSGPDT